MSFEPGELVEGRCVHGEARIGRISGRVRDGYDTWYVTAGVGMTYCDNGGDVRPANAPTETSTQAPSR
jgi:hypothetical protein